MRLVIASLLGLALGPALAGCDREMAGGPQGRAPAGNEAAPSAERYPTGVLDRSHAGTRAPAIEFEDPEGRLVSLADFRGRPLLINLWATWCAPCVIEMPTLDRLAGREGEALQLLAISQDFDGRDKVADFFAERRFEHLQPYLDSQLGLMTSLGIENLPTTILYDAEGREVWRMTGRADWESGRIARLLTEARGG